MTGFCALLILRMWRHPKLGGSKVYYTLSTSVGSYVGLMLLAEQWCPGLIDQPHGMPMAYVRFTLTRTQAELDAHSWHVLTVPNKH